MFKKTHQNTIDTIDDNPYFNARRAWNDQLGETIAARRLWQAVALIALMGTLGAIGGIIHIGSQSKFVPYVIEIDKLGQAIAVAPAQVSSPVDQRVIKATVSAFVNDLRLVTPDISLQRKAIFSIFAHLAQGDPAFLKSTELFNTKELNPFERAAKEMVSIDIDTALQHTPDTWQIDWTETIRDRQGAIQSESQWRALVTVYVAETQPTTTEEQLKSNPMSIYIKDFTWSKQL